MTTPYIYNSELIKDLPLFIVLLSFMYSCCSACYLLPYRYLFMLVGFSHKTVFDER